MWKGAISFGLVTIPVRVFPSTEEKSLKFNQLHDADGGRIKMKRTCSKCGEEVPFEHIVKGYEVEKDQYVLLSDEDFDQIPVESSRNIDIVQFVELAEPRLAFAQEVALRDGANAIDVVASDLVGQQARARLTVHLDRHGPLLSLEQVEVVGTPPPPRVRVQGLLTDQNRITRFMLAGRTVPPQPGSAWEVREDLPLTGSEEFVVFEAEDAAGNVTRGQIALRAPVDGPGGTRQGRPAPKGDGDGQPRPCCRCPRAACQRPWDRPAIREVQPAATGRHVARRPPNR
jgi:hypothetical protein